MFPELHYLWCGNRLLGKRFWIAYFWNPCCWYVAHSIIYASLSHTLRNILLPNTLLQALTDSHLNILGKLRTLWQFSSVSVGWAGASPFDITDGETMALFWRGWWLKASKQASMIRDLTVNKKEVSQKLWGRFASPSTVLLCFSEKSALLDCS